MTLVPAYGRDYKSKAEVVTAWNAGKDFLISQPSNRWNGKPTNKEQITETVNIRYKGLREVCVIPYRPEGQSRVRTGARSVGGRVPKEAKYGVFVWRGDGHYRESDALALYTLVTQAERHIAWTPDSENLVVRRLALISRP